MNKDKLKIEIKDIFHDFSKNQNYHKKKKREYKTILINNKKVKVQFL